MKQEYEVINEEKDERRFFDKHKGEWIIIKPGGMITTTTPPDNKCFTIKEIGKAREKRRNKIVLKEDE